MTVGRRVGEDAVGVRVGLLECDHVDERFSVIAGDYRDMFSALLPSLDLVPYDVVGGQVPADPGECDGWLCTGSRQSAYDDLGWIEALCGFVGDVRAAGTPFVGVCFGHQVLAHALGGRVERADAGWGVGVHAVEVAAPASWMDPPRGQVALQFMHQDQVTAVPEGAVVLGSSEHCPAAVMAVGKTMVGIQAHPEFGAEYARALIDARERSIGAERAGAARESLRSPTDESVVAGWMTRFLGSGERP